MQVMCIAKEWQDQTGDDPVFGEVCTVVGELDIFYPAYVLLEHPRKGGYIKVGFVPLVDDEEIESVSQIEEPEHAEQ